MQCSWHCSQCLGPLAFQNDHRRSRLQTALHPEGCAQTASALLQELTPPLMQYGVTISVTTSEFRTVVSINKCGCSLEVGHQEDDDGVF